MRRIAVVLLNLGSPQEPEDVKPFLLNLFLDPAIIRAPRLIRGMIARMIVARRWKSSQANYATIGGSPLLQQTFAQAEALQVKLRADSDEKDAVEWEVFVAMRYWHPFAEEVVGKLMEWNPTEVIMVPLYPQCSTATTHSSVRSFLEAMSAVYGDVPHPFLSVLGCYPTLPGFVDHFAEEILLTLKSLRSVSRETRASIGADCDRKSAEALEQQVDIILPEKSDEVITGDGDSKDAHTDSCLIVFSAHGLPQRIVDEGDPYILQVEQAASAIVQALFQLGDEADIPVPPHAICFQSRVGPVAWVKPYTDEYIRTHAQGRDIIVVPLSFVSEHIETLLELDIELKEMALTAGANSYHRIATPQVSEGFIAGLSGITREITGFHKPSVDELESGYRPVDVVKQGVRYFAPYDCCGEVAAGHSDDGTTLDDKGHKRCLCAFGVDLSARALAFVEGNGRGSTPNHFAEKDTMAAQPSTPSSLLG
ncbi:MAG: ferrochelatase [Alphaproteobacteria bacterium]|nr:ferrochelatase [Alphaproteobacteria bacterium]